MSSSSNYVTLETLRGTGCALLVVGTIVTAVRLAPPLMHPRTFQWDDGFLIGAYFFFLVVSILYQVVAETLFKMQDVSSGKIKPYPTIMDDTLFMQTIFFFATSSLWFNLWCVKYSLLAFYKRLIAGLKTYTIIWTIIVVFCFVVLVGAVTSSMLSCSSMKAWFTAGACNTPRDIKAASISLWYAFAVDVLTDLLVMFLPVGLIWRVQMPLMQKASIGGLFCLGFVCIIVAIVRVRELGATTSESSAPSTTWLAFWGTVETAIALIIGCCPGLYRRFRPHITGTKASYNSYAYGYGNPRSGTGGNTFGSRVGGNDLELQQGRGTGSRIRKTTDINISTQIYGDAASSQEELTAEHQTTRDPTRPSDMYSFEVK